ncbi:DUF3618 domain-containing protein [Actinomadura sp. HBU206391]|uniref:DUF3618 domain-containing protein n=1 Tax=Actinomadura sp. HBU206391 TaxID=2731692 RepID=UPI001650420D|nr:DUF3618 domain-containing protein [Actinomadura sp. HBU206391]MBC6459587.1 DUF3618 domain-containing protein [Actinomadura sp. HBU206391]
MADRARDPEALELEIMRTREELARTVDALADRLNPKNAARRGVVRMKEEAGQVAAAIGAISGPREPGEPNGDRRTAALMVGAGIAISVTAVLLWRRKRR